MLAFTVVAGSAMSNVDTRPPAVLAVEWAEAAKAARKLPTTLDEFEEYPLIYRKAAFIRLEPVVASSVMRSHLRAILDSGTWNAEQRAAIERAILLASPEAYTKGRSKQIEEGLIANCQAMAKVFSEDDRKLFSTLGRRQVSAEARYVNSVRKAKGYLGDQPLTADAYLHECNCVGNTVCPDCNPNDACVFGHVPACSDTWFGCGCSWAFGCDGECRRVV